MLRSESQGIERCLEMKFLCQYTPVIFQYVNGWTVTLTGNGEDPPGEKKLIADMFPLLRQAVDRPPLSIPYEKYRFIYNESFAP